MRADCLCIFEYPYFAAASILKRSSQISQSNCYVRQRVPSLSSVGHFSRTSISIFLFYLREHTSQPDRAAFVSLCFLCEAWQPDAPVSGALFCRAPPTLPFSLDRIYLIKWRKKGKKIFLLVNRPAFRRSVMHGDIYTTNTTLFSLSLRTTARSTL